jgi:hypothetical protein
VIVHSNKPDAGGATTAKVKKAGVTTKAMKNNTHPTILKMGAAPHHHEKKSERTRRRV